MATNGSFTGVTANSQIVPTIVWSATQNYAANSSTITATLYYSRTNSTGDRTVGYWDGTLTIDGNTKTAENKYIKISYQSNTVAISHTVTVKHNDNGSRNVTISATGLIPSTSLSSTSISATITLDPFDRLSMLSVSGGALGTSQKLTVIKMQSSFTHTITYACGSSSGTICSKSTSTSITWTPPLVLASENTTGATVIVTFTITTYDGNTALGSYTPTYAFSIPSSVRPSCRFEVTDPMGHLDTYGAYIKGLSKFSVSITPVLSYGSPITAYKTEANGVTYTESSFTTDILKTAGEAIVSATVTDMRGRSGGADMSLEVLDYSAPSVTALSVHRSNADGTANDKGEYVRVQFSASVTSLNSKNNATYLLLYKKSSETYYTTVSLSAYKNVYNVSNGYTIISADSGSSYDIELRAIDDFGLAAKSTSASTGFTLMHWLASGLGMAIGKVAELANVLDIGFKTRFSGGILPIRLPSGTNLDDVKTPNFYQGRWMPDSAFLNAPVETGHFVLEVYQSHEEVITFQRFTVWSGAAVKTYHRFCNEHGTWYAWHSTDDDVSALSAKVSTLQNTVNNIKTSPSYADGFLYVPCGALPNAGQIGYSFSLPSTATEYWIESGWAAAGNIRYPLPFVGWSGSTSGIVVFLSGQTIQVCTEQDYSAFTAHFVIGYKNG